MDSVTLREANLSKTVSGEIDLENQFVWFQRIAVGIAYSRGVIETIIHLEVNPANFHLSLFNICFG